MAGYVAISQGFSQQQSLATRTRYIAEIAGFIPFEEKHTDVLEITEHPIEQGAKISDHAYKRPCKVTIKVGWSNSSTGGTSGAAHMGTGSGQIEAIYQSLLGLQAMRTPFPVMTGKRLYENMLLEELSVETDRITENALMVTAVFKEIIMVNTQSVTIGEAPADSQASPEATQGVKSSGIRTLAPLSGISSPEFDAVLMGG